MAEMNRRIVLASRPHGEPTLDNFRLDTAPLPTPGEGEVLALVRDGALVERADAGDTVDVERLRQRSDRYSGARRDASLEDSTANFLINRLSDRCLGRISSHV